MLRPLFSGVAGGYALAAALLLMGRPPHMALLAIALGGTVLTLAAAALLADPEDAKA